MSYARRLILQALISVLSEEQKQAAIALLEGHHACWHDEMPQHEDIDAAIDAFKTETVPEE